MIVRVGSEKSQVKPEVVGVVSDIVNKVVGYVRDSVKSDYTIDTRELTIHIDSNGDVSFGLSVIYYIRVMGINDMAEYYVEKYEAENNKTLSSDERDRLYEDFRNQLIDEVNEKYGLLSDVLIEIRNSKKIYGANKLVIFVYPLVCASDNCKVGLEASISLDKIPLKFLKDFKNDIAKLIASLLIKAFDIIMN